MNDVYQHAKPDGSPEWSEGEANWARNWDVVGDLARFHGVAAWRIRKRPDPKFGQIRVLSEARDRLAYRLQHNPAGTVFELRSEKDKWSHLLRRMQVPEGGVQIVEWFERHLGAPYDWGNEGPYAFDCSGSMLAAHATLGIELRRTAAEQHAMFKGGVTGFLSITRAQVKRGDPLYTNNDAHTGAYYGEYRGVECIIDTEPSNTEAPWGSGETLGVGIRIRPMTGNYYNAWDNVNGIGRIVAVNGAP